MMGQEAKKGWKVMVPGDSITQEAWRYLEDHGHSVALYENRSYEVAVEQVREQQPDAIIISDLKMDKGMFEAGSPNLKVMARFGAGFDGVDLAEADRRGVVCLYAAHANSFSVAELVFFHMLHFSFNIGQIEKNLKIDFELAKQGTTYSNIAGKTLGIIGVGNIGSRVAKLAMAFHMNVLGYDPYKPAKDFPAGVRVVRDLDALLRESDYISLHAPVTPITRNLICKETLGKMKPTACLINTARGALVNEADVIEALKNGVIAGAEFDTFVDEPVDPAREVLNTEKLYPTSHLGGSTVEAKRRVCMMNVLGIQEVYEGKEPSCLIPRTDYMTAPVYDDLNEEPAYEAPDILDMKRL